MKRAIDEQRRLAKAASRATVTQRVYRLALLNDPTYADYFGTQNVLAEKVTLMNRVNQIYNDDAAISMVLVDGTDLLNFDTVAEGDRTGRPVRGAPLLHPRPDVQRLRRGAAVLLRRRHPACATRPCSAS